MRGHAVPHEIGGHPACDARRSRSDRGVAVALAREQDARVQLVGGTLNVPEWMDIGDIPMDMDDI